MTCVELQAMEPADVLAMDKADIVASIFEGVTRHETVNTYEGNDLVEQVQTTTDAYENPIGSMELVFTYYGTGEIDEIEITEKDDQGEVIDTYTIKHYKGLKQPEILGG
jgi:hypothetical protein